MRIKFKDMETIEKGSKFDLFIVVFEDDRGKEYKWAPKWEDVQAIFEFGYAQEQFNEGKDWRPFAETSLWVLHKVIQAFGTRKIESPLKVMRREKPNG